MKYAPGILPADPVKAIPILQRELQKLQSVIDQIHQFDILYKAPDKPQEFQLEAADGDNWNPGAGKGLYAYYNSRWNGLMNLNYALEVAKGNIPGTTGVNKFGRNEEIASGATEEIWDGSTAYTFPTTASITHIKADVDSATMQGMVVNVQGLDTNWALTVQTATLDGTDATTEVALTTALRRVFRMYVLDSSVADQAISIGPTGFATTQAKITAGYNQTQMAIYTVPAGKTAYLTKYYATLNPAAAKVPTSMQVNMWKRDNVNGYAPQLQHTVGLDIDASSMIERHMEPYISFGEKTDIWITGTTVGSSADISAGFDLYLVDD